MPGRDPTISGDLRSLRRLRRDELEKEVERLRHLAVEGSRHQEEMIEAHRGELRRRRAETLSVEHLLAESRDRLSALYDFAPIALLTLDDEGLVRDVNLTGAELLERSPGEVEGRALADFAEHRNLLLEHLARCRRAAGGTVVGELELRRRDGERLPVELHSRIHHEHDEAVLYIALRDLRERRRLEDALAEAVSTEQRRLAEVLHDDLGQVLAGAVLLAGGLERRRSLAGDAAGAAALHDLVASVREAQRRVRDLARDFHSAIEQVTAENLPEMLAALADRTLRQLGIPCRSSVAGGVAVDDEVADQLYHIAREAVTNACRHGAPAAVSIELGSDGSSWLLRVRDDGCGFDDAAPRQGLGMHLMAYRTRRLGGELSVRSEPGAGTTVTCRVPRRAERTREPR